MIRIARTASPLVGLLFVVGCAQMAATPPASGNAGNGVAGTAADSGTSGAAGAPAAGAGGGSGGAGAGTAGRGGSAGGQSGSAGLGGAAAVGVAGSGGGTDCTITPTTTLSTQIPTVAIVTFTTTVTGVTSASIQFGLPGATPYVAPVDLAATNYRTLLLGMKGSRDYVYRIVVNSAAGSCTSQDVMLRTGAVPASVPKPTRTIPMPSAHAPGFIITSPGAGGGSVPVYIVDRDGDAVWWAAAPSTCSRAKMSWDGKEMWMQELNVDNAGGEMRKVAMDGSGAMTVAGLARGHHDFTVLPDGGIALCLWSTAGADVHNLLVERSASGQMTTIIPDLNAVYTATSFHPNAIHYHPSDNSYTISDRNVNMFVKVTRSGQLVWQLGGGSPKGQAFSISGGTWMVNHGHHLLPNGNFLFFSNGPFSGGTSQALEYSLNTTSWTATRVWQYAPGLNSPVLCDAQRLPNGNTLVTFSTVGTIHEVTPSGQLVMSLDTASVGYVDYRESLYGPPLR